MAVKIALSEHVETFGNVSVVKWLKREQDIIVEGDTIAFVREDDEGVIAIRADQKGMLAKILIPEGTDDLLGKEIIGVIASLGDEKDDIIRAIMTSQHLNGLLEGMTLADDEEEDDDDDSENHDSEGEDEDDTINTRSSAELEVIGDLDQPPDADDLSPASVKALSCLVGAVFLLYLSIATNFGAGFSFVLFLANLVAGFYSLRFVKQLIDERDREVSDFMSSIGAMIGAVVLFIVGWVFDSHQGLFLATMIIAAVAAIFYAGYHNVQQLGIGDGISVTVIESAFAPLVIVIGVLYYLRHDVVRSIAPGMVSSNAKSSNSVPTKPFDVRLSQPKQIGNVVQRGGFIIIQDDRGVEIGAIGFRAGDELRGFTSTTVSVKQGGFINIYNSKGSRVGGTRAS